MRPYCTRVGGDCSTCSLVNYGRDCMNQPADPVEWLVKNCTLADLRRRQDLTTAQIAEAHRQGNTEAIEQLRRMESDLDAAVAAKAELDEAAEVQS